MCGCVLSADVLTYQARLGGRQQGKAKPVSVQLWDGQFVRELEDKWQDHLQLDLAGATHRTYSSQQQQYRDFCYLMKRAPLPDAHTLAQFVVGRAMQGYALSTIEQGVYAVARWGADLGCEALANDGEVKRALKVAAKLAVPKGKQKLPLDRRDLRRVVYALADRGRADFQGVRDRALFLLGWVGMFRSSELVGVTWRDVCFAEEGGALIYVPRSKTDQAGQGAWVFIAACPEEPLMCPVAALRVLQSVTTSGEAPAVGPVFVGRASHPVALAKTTVAVRLRKALQAVGVQEWELYAAHSLRRGGATWAVRQGVSWRRVQIMGRWKSDVVREYLYSSVSSMWGASAQMQRG